MPEQAQAPDRHIQYSQACDEAAVGKWHARKPALMAHKQVTMVQAIPPGFR